LLVILGAVAGALSVVYLTMPVPEGAAVITPADAGMLLASIAVVLLAWAAIDTVFARRRRD
jgi:ubiquinone biosynthesis protein